MLRCMDERVFPGERERYIRTARIIIFIALSIAGALIKMPSPLGSIAFDSAPAYFSAVTFGLYEGVPVAIVGHLASAYVAGFPLSLPMHIVVGIYMALAVSSFRVITVKAGIIAGGVVAVVINGIIGSFLVYPLGGMGMVIAVMPFLTLASLANVLIAGIAYRGYRRA